MKKHLFKKLILVFSFLAIIFDEVKAAPPSSQSVSIKNSVNSINTNLAGAAQCLNILSTQERILKKLEEIQTNKKKFDEEIKDLNKIISNQLWQSLAFLILGPLSVFLSYKEYIKCKKKPIDKKNKIKKFALGTIFFCGSVATVCGLILLENSAYLEYKKRSLTGQ